MARCQRSMSRRRRVAQTKEGRRRTAGAHGKRRGLTSFPGGSYPRKGGRPRVDLKLRRHAEQGRGECRRHGKRSAFPTPPWTTLRVDHIHHRPGGIATQEERKKEARRKAARRAELRPSEELRTAARERATGSRGHCHWACNAPLVFPVSRFGEPSGLRCPDRGRGSGGVRDRSVREVPPL